MNSASIKVYNSVDLFKFLMSVAVVAIHTNPIVYCTNEFVIRVTVMIEDWAVPFSSLHLDSFYGIAMKSI